MVEVIHVEILQEMPQDFEYEHWTWFRRANQDKIVCSGTMQWFEEHKHYLLDYWG